MTAAWGPDAWFKPVQGSTVTLRPPRHQMRGIQPLTPEQSTELTRPGARVSLSNDQQLVLGRELPTTRLLDQLRVRQNPGLDGAPAVKKAQSGYAVLVFSNGAILPNTYSELRHHSTSDLALRLSELTAEAVSHELGREGPADSRPFLCSRYG